MGTEVVHRLRAHLFFIELRVLWGAMLVVSLHASQLDDPSLNPAEVNFPGFFVYTILKD